MNLSGIVREVARTGKHVAIGSYGTLGAVIVSAAEALPHPAFTALIECSAETTGVTIATDEALPEGIPDLLTWWSSLTPAPPMLALFLNRTIESVSTQASVSTSTAKRLAADTICAYTGWSRNDWVRYLNL